VFSFIVLQSPELRMLLSLASLVQVLTLAGWKKVKRIDESLEDIQQKLKKLWSGRQLTLTSAASKGPHRLDLG
jgi:hypothetical protein